LQNKISIIIPIYNLVKYLAKCLDSVINQSYKNLEIILINDGSTDGSDEIINEYSVKDKRINAMNIDKHGLSYSRNIGLKKATGKFIGFVDGDDFLENDMYENLLKTLLDFNADIAQCAHYNINENGKIKQKKYTYNLEHFTGINGLIELILGKKFNNSVWNKIYRKDVIKGIWFPKDKLGEDISFNYKAFARARISVSIDIPKYYYLSRKGSISTNMKYLDKIDPYYIHLERLNFIKREFPSLFYLEQKQFYNVLLGLYGKLVRNPDRDIDKRKRKIIEDYINDNYRLFIANPLFTNQQRLLLGILKRNTKFGLFLILICKKINTKLELIINISFSIFKLKKQNKVY